MSHFPYRKRRKNLLTADKTKATKTKSQQLQTTGFGFGSVCLVFFFGGGETGRWRFTMSHGILEQLLVGLMVGLLGGAGWCRVVGLRLQRTGGQEKSRATLTTRDNCLNFGVNEHEHTLPKRDESFSWLKRPPSCLSIAICSITIPFQARFQDGAMN